MEEVTCSNCGDSRATLVAEPADWLLNRPKIAVRLMRCQTCGLVYQNPRPTLDEMGQHYPPAYEPYADTAATAQRGGLIGAAIRYGMNKRCRFVLKHKASGRVLDVGCASGSFLLAMRAAAPWSVFGVEINQAVALQARARYGLEILPVALEEASLAPNSFDAVTMWDVLEHVHDPAGTLAEIYRILKPGGVLVVRVPNLDSWDAKLFGPYWAGLDAPRHLFVFTPTTLSQMLRRAGFDVVEHSAQIGGYVTFVLSVRFWMTAHQVSPRVSELVTRALYNPLSRLLSAPIFYLPSLLRKGPLLVTTARKPG